MPNFKYQLQQALNPFLSPDASNPLGLNPVVEFTPNQTSFSSEATASPWDGVGVYQQQTEPIMRGPASDLSIKSQALQKLVGSNAADFQAKPDAYEAVFKQGIDDRKGWLGELQNRLKTMNETRGDTFTNMDLSPALALVDSWTGSNLSKGYNGANWRQENELKRAKIEDAINKERQSLTDDQVNYLKLKSSQNSDLQYLKLLGMMRGQDINKDAKEQRNLLNVESKMQDDLKKVSDERIADITALGNIRSALEDGNIQSVKTNLGYIARLVGGQKGAISDQDAANVLPKTWGTTWASAKAYFGKLNKLDPQTLTIMKNLVDTATKSSEARYKDKLRSRFNMYSNGETAPLMKPGGAGYGKFQAIGYDPAAEDAARKKMQDLVNKAKGGK